MTRLSAKLGSLHADLTPPNIHTMFIQGWKDSGSIMQWSKTCSFKRPCIVLCIPCFKTNLPQPLLLIFEFFGQNQWTNIIFPLIRIITTNLIKPAILIILCINLMLFLIIPEFKDHKKYWGYTYDNKGVHLFQKVLLIWRLGERIMYIWSKIR